MDGCSWSGSGTLWKRVDFSYFCTELINKGWVIPNATDIPGRDESKQKGSVGYCRKNGMFLIGKIVF